MTTMREFLDDNLRHRSVENVSRGVFPKFWEAQDAAAARSAADAEADLEEALTMYDKPCMSHFQA